MHQVYVPLDIEKMRAAAKVLEGEHDFKSFSSTATQVTDFVRTIYDISIVEVDHGIEIRVTGNGFLYNMVRIIAGTLIDVGRGQIEVSKMEEILEARNREAAGPTAPAKGLSLEEIRFLELE
jgi:tRNA pseudouridine38-40 synthase